MNRDGFAEFTNIGLNQNRENANFIHRRSNIEFKVFENYVKSS